MERELAAAIRSIATPAGEAYRAGGPVSCLQTIETIGRPAIQRVLSRQLLRTALIFGGRLLDDLAERTKGATGTKGFRDVFEGVIRAWVDAHALARAVSVTGTIRERVRGVIATGVEEGTGEAGIAKTIVETVGRILSRTNAARIARTEVHTAASVGADEAARATGLEMVKEWAAVEDKRTRLSHFAADGQTVEMEEPFVIGGGFTQVPPTALRFPGDPDAPAREIVNCRCVPLYHPRIGGEIIR